MKILIYLTLTLLLIHPSFSHKVDNDNKKVFNGSIILNDHKMEYELKFKVMNHNIYYNFILKNILLLDISEDDINELDSSKFEVSFLDEDGFEIMKKSFSSSEFKPLEHNLIIQSSDMISPQDKSIIHYIETSKIILTEDLEKKVYRGLFGPLLDLEE